MMGGVIFCYTKEATHAAMKKVGGIVEEARWNLGRTLKPECGERSKKNTVPM
jgi:hypothetical protein